MNKGKYKSILFGILVFVLIVLIHRIPLYLLLQHIGLSETTSDIIDKIILNTLVIFLTLREIKKRNLWKTAGLSLKIMKSPYLYAILLIYLFIFTGGFSSMQLIPSFQLISVLVLLFLIKSITVGILEEVVFRGLIQGNILKNFQGEQNGVVKSVILSGLLFGIAHIINIGEDYISFNSTIRQIFAATCLGTLFGAVLLRTKNIYPIILIHSAISFFSLIGTLFPEYFPDKIEEEKSKAELIASTVFVILLFGSAFIIAMFLLRKKLNEEEDVTTANG